MEKTSLTIEEIQEIIPHRYPFLLIDKIDELEEGKKAIGTKNVTMNEYFFQGHFPKKPVMPGVLIIEALAQVGAVALLSCEDFKGKIAYFGGIKKARFKKMVIPGDVLKLEVEIISMKGPIGIGKATATVDGKVACQAELSFAIG
ncbi:3-hydroxyacyl-ACP dehydratase FabZ [Clostridium senegalense]|uniref:3-hydroxyacyl-ACP dehydratase FabZ n=1 Tax=Clostridium senegalense TaxID=1465809 RepID=UPI000287D88F|nr:3-hydroxyacyl-ACP dehydratase FabZ [Clostridium senegalense]MBU5226666.1 3-hydroxyacyl-ACP dehydratase FabZ [Clostridium senegalense]